MVLPDFFQYVDRVAENAVLGVQFILGHLFFRFEHVSSPCVSLVFVSIASEIGCIAVVYLIVKAAWPVEQDAGEGHKGREVAAGGLSFQLRGFVCAV